MHKNTYLLINKGVLKIKKAPVGLFVSKII